MGSFCDIPAFGQTPSAWIGSSILPLPSLHRKAQTNSRRCSQQRESSCSDPVCSLAAILNLWCLLIGNR